jgi:hypothetical protein
MWLSHHGRDALIARYGAENLVDIFQRALCDACVKFPGWKEGKFGAGLIDAYAVLDADLPEVWSQRESPVKMTMQLGSGVNPVGLPLFHHLFDSAADSDLLFALCALLRTSESDLDRTLNEIGHELAFHLATDPQAYHAFREIAQSCVAPDAPAIDALRKELASRASSRLRAHLTEKKRASGKGPLTRSRLSEP